MAILSHFEPKNWFHIFLEANLAKILMDYVLLTLPASLAKIRRRVYFFFHPEIIDFSIQKFLTVKERETKK